MTFLALLPRLLPLPTVLSTVEVFHIEVLQHVPDYKSVSPFESPDSPAQFPHGFSANVPPNFFHYPTELFVLQTPHEVQKAPVADFPNALYLNGHLLS